MGYTLNVKFEIRKATKTGQLKINQSEVKLRSLTIGTLTQEEAEFLHELGSDIYILSLFQTGEFDGARKKCHRLYKATNPKKTISPTQRVDKFFRPRIVELIFSDIYPMMPKNVNFKDFAQASSANVGKIGESAFYLDECNVDKIISYCVDRISERVERTENLTHNDFFDMIDGLKDLKRNISRDKLKLFGVEIDEEPMQSHDR